MPNSETVRVGAVVLAAGMSRRMGQAKLILPYRDGTVLGAVLTALHTAEVTPIITVTGGAREAVEELISRLPFDILIAHNPHPERTEMLDSLRIGMEQLPAALDAFLVVLGDQPQIQPEVISQLVREHKETGEPLIIPSYQMRRGHPWLIGRDLWDDLRSMEPSQTMRDFLHKNSGRIHYLLVNTSSVLEDLDTPEDYRRATGVE